MVGDYRIDHTIGIGGMAAVYQATQPLIGKRVAIKVLHSSKSTSALNRFVTEARAVNLIGHPNIVDVFGFGMMDDGRAYLVMELLVGETLAVRAKRGSMPLAEICDVLVEVTHALEAAHAAGIIHRDLKPENIFLARRKGAVDVKLLDFGIAKLLVDCEPGMIEETRPGVLIGTPRYISPEQVRGQPLDGRTDVYALGVVAFELVAGRPPFIAGDCYEMFEKHAKLRPPQPSAFNPALPEQANALIGAMLAKEPAQRPGLAEVRRALDELRAAPPSPNAASRTVANEKVTDVVGVVGATPTDEVTNLAEIDALTRARSRRRRPRLPLALAGALLATAAIAIALVIAHGGGARLHAEAAAPPGDPPAVAHEDPAPAEPASANAPDAPVAAVTGVDTSKIKLDPVAHAATPPPRTATRHVRPPARARSAPERRAAKAEPAHDKPAASDEDAVMSPFGAAR